MRPKQNLEARFARVRALPARERARVAVVLEELVSDAPTILSAEELAIIEPEFWGARQGIFAQRARRGPRPPPAMAPHRERVIPWLEFRPRAVADLAAIRDTLLEHAGEVAAERVRQHCEKRFALLVRNPFHRNRYGAGLASGFSALSGKMPQGVLPWGVR
jgi:ParE toxin of type II toxin-antitoxin system, parDE